MITEAHPSATLSVSVVVHDSDLTLLERTLSCLLDSLAEAQRVGCLSAAKLVLYDNASPPAYVESLRALYNRFVTSHGDLVSHALILGETNIGFGAGHNTALCHDSSTYVLILNPDAELSADAIGIAVHCLEAQEEVIAVNPSCTGDDGERAYLGKRYPSLLDLYLRGFAGEGLRRRFSNRLAHYEYRDEDPQASRTLDLLSGACLFTRGEGFRAAGGFDARFFLYFEDFDLSLRLARQGDLLYLPSMRIQHHGGAAARKGWRHRWWFVRSAWRFFRLHGWRLW